jgi:predicted Zn finger-like uncharacterized protein
MIGVAYTHGDLLSVFTQCSKCETVFRLSAEVLRAAGGQVRCGRCGEVFNALARLAEDATSFTQGESSLELETRADEILQSLEPVAPADTAPSQGLDIVQLEILDALDDELTAEASLEFTLAPGELDRIFIETVPPGPLQWLVADSHRGARTADETGEAAPMAAAPSPVAPTSLPAHTSSVPTPPAAHTSAVPTPPVPTPVAPPRTASTSAVPTPAAYAQAVPKPAAPTTAALPRAVPAATVAAAAAAVAASSAPASGLEVSEDVRRDMLSSFTHAELPEINAPRRQLPFAAWVSAAAVLSILLAAQMIHSNRDWLASAHLLGGGSTTLAANLAAYQLRQWGVTGDPAAKGTLRVRASIMNAAAQLQPYPLLRVTLANRFGTRVGEREFEPAEYLGRATARLLSPGERIDATLDILDPGKDAEGFEIDVCVRGAEKKILCAGDAAAADAGAAHAATQAH